MRAIAWLLVAVLALNANEFAIQTGAPTSSVPTRTNETERSAKMKADVQRRGSGEKARVRVTLRNGAKIKGYISRIDESSFEVTDQASGKLTTISYEDVSEVKGLGLSRTAKILIIVAVVAGVIIGLVALACSSEGGPHC